MPISASHQDGTYPRPQLVRDQYLGLDGDACFAYDDADRGRDEHWESDPQVFDRVIRLPFPPESPASGVGDTGFHPILWYRIPVTESDLVAAGLGAQGERILLHFGAVDYSADVWVDGQHVAHHEGGQTSFSVDITTALWPATVEHVIVVRAVDDPADVTMPRGKQDWLLEPHAIWYHRTSGIWRTVWLEAVPRLRVDALRFDSDLPRASVRAEIELSRRPVDTVTVRIEFSFNGDPIGAVAIDTRVQTLAVEVPLLGQSNGQHCEQLLWSPETPRLIDAAVTVVDAAGVQLDTVSSYLGLRSTAVGQGVFLLNHRPYFVRAVLEQGYWPQSHLAAPSVDALREEAELIKSLGFNAARIHQKVEDPRFLYWADRLGLMIWGETAGAYEFSTQAVGRLTLEWAQIVQINRSHPSIVTWVPFNESWGIQHAADDRAQRAFMLGLVNLTRALDPTRPVISNDGWEHTDSDVWSIHDYEGSPDVLRERYGSPTSITTILDGIGPSGRRTSINEGGRIDRGQPVMLTEFGGVSFAPGTALTDSWGYSTARDSDDFQNRLSGILDAVHASPVLAGFCYTQLTDTRQETNGLADENRKPKLPAEVIAQIIGGAC
ncbi:glycoside hydrolase family 2 protein [Rathayibacter soli]|uniref:glycoside hydrolase family 2 protein n=1 Tax=Rathayibacter soli TaxID=3144168 RepID=UPI0027E50723|nr:glycoside hydrolase family 2 TIM barrel-domain containing protein [Glaciibacter superstes]